MDGDTSKVLARLESQCAKREYCSAEMLHKALKLLDGDADKASEVLLSLKENKFVDDRRYASAFAREKATLGGWGPVKIRYELGGKKIGREDIDAALAEVDSCEAGKRLEKLMQAKWKTLQADPQAKLKLLKFALSRGYDYDSVQKTAEKICKNEE